MGRKHRYGIDYDTKGLKRRLVKKITYIFSDWKRIEGELRGKFLYIFLDYDGTLAPIAPTPVMAVMPKETKDLLRRLSEMPDCKIAIVSGRALKDITKRIGLGNIVYVGNHGFEIKGPSINFRGALPRLYRRALGEIRRKLKKNLSLFGGVVIEDKGLSLGAHYRMADARRISAIEAEFYRTIFPYEFKNNVKSRAGKMAMEIIPPVPWNKGKAVLWLLDKQLPVMRNKKMKILPIYIGDDATDEDAFESLKDKGITIFTGKPGKTKARYYLKNSEEVAGFLEEILKI